MICWSPNYSNCSRVKSETSALCLPTLRINSINVYILDIFPFVFICYHDF